MQKIKRLSALLLSLLTALALTACGDEPELSSESGKYGSWAV